MDVPVDNKLFSRCLNLVSTWTTGRKYLIETDKGNEFIDHLGRIIVLLGLQ